MIITTIPIKFRDSLIENKIIEDENEILKLNKELVDETIHFNNLLINKFKFQKFQANLIIINIINLLKNLLKNVKKQKVI